MTNLANQMHRVRIPMNRDSDRIRRNLQDPAGCFDPVATARGSDTD